MRYYEHPMKLNAADNHVLKRLRTVLPTEVIREFSDRYFSEPRGLGAGRKGPILAPGDASLVAEILKIAESEKVPVIPYGGGTGLVGGQLALDGPAPLILSLERMNKIRAVYPTENVMIAEAGVILADAQSAAENHNRLFPLSLAAEGSATIGGNLATNAGGVNVLRYGNTRDLCLGIEAVFADGTIWNGLSRLRKDNTGYDLRNLLVGSEGTLGIITAASLKLSSIPASVGTALMVLNSPQAALELLSMARDHVGEGVSAFELINSQGLQFIKETLPDIRQPFKQIPEWCVLIELGLIKTLDATDALETLYTSAADEGLVVDGLIASSQSQRDEFWAVREHIPEANRCIGAISSHDLSIPIGVIPEYINRARECIARIGEFRINCFGHVGDGNLHYNIFPMPGRTRAEHSEQVAQIKTTIHDLVHEMGGSISAEHGIGRWKIDELEKYGDPAKLVAMRSIKNSLDPAGILNPGAVLR